MHRRCHLEVSSGGHHSSGHLSRVSTSLRFGAQTMLRGSHLSIHSLLITYLNSILQKHTYLVSNLFKNVVPGFTISFFCGSPIPYIPATLYVAPPPHTPPSFSPDFLLPTLAYIPPPTPSSLLPPSAFTPTTSSHTLVYPLLPSHPFLLDSVPCCKSSLTAPLKMLLIPLMHDSIPGGWYTTYTHKINASLKFWYTISFPWPVPSH